MSDVFDEISFNSRIKLLGVYMNTNAMTQVTVCDLDTTFSAQTSCVTWTCRVT